MTRPIFSVQPLESRRLLSANAVEELASALGGMSDASGAGPMQTDFRTDHQALDRNVEQLKSALASLANQMQHVYEAVDAGHQFTADPANLPPAISTLSANLTKLQGG